jgi:glutamate carboxypeptidase
MNGDAVGTPICLSAHMDTVHPVGSFGTPAARIAEDEDKIYGPGTTDCKGGIAVALLAMRALQKMGYTDRPIKLILQSDEEKGSAPSELGTVKKMCELAKGSAAFFNLEGSHPPKVTLARKGIIRFTFKVHGKEAHAAACAKEGANAILEASHKIIECERLKDDDGITCSCNVIEGGSAQNTVPRLCVFHADVRYATKAQREEVIAYMQALADKTFVDGCSTELIISGGRIAMERTERNERLFDRMNEIFEEYDLGKRIPFFARGGSDAAYITEAGIPCVDNFGSSGGSIHSPNEYGWISSLPRAAKELAVLIVKL